MQISVTLDANDKELFEAVAEAADQMLAWAATNGSRAQTTLRRVASQDGSTELSELSELSEAVRAIRLLRDVVNGGRGSTLGQFRMGSESLEKLEQTVERLTKVTHA